MFRLRPCLLSILLLVLGPVASAATENRSAEDWLSRSQDARFPGDNMVAEFTLEIVQANGQKLERKGRSARASRDRKLADRLFVITEPRSIAGMALLSKDVADGPAHQWLYLPAYRRVRRVAIHGAGDAFVGSDFYYADLARVRIEAAEHTLTGEATIADRPCVIIESRNTDSALPYGRVTSSLDKENALPLRVEYYDRSDVLLKVGTIDSVELRDGYPTPVSLTMTNARTNSRSRIVLENVRYDTELDDGQFTVERLEERGPPL